MSGTTRRQLLARGAALTAAGAVPAGLLATPALAQADDQTEALERLIELEQAAELAYSLTEQDKGITGNISKLAEAFRTQESAHAKAFSSAVDQLGVEAAEGSDDPASYDSLDGLEAARSADARLDFLIGLEEGLVSAYEDETINLEATDLFRTAAQVAANHAQHLVALRLARGDAPASAARLPAASTSAPADKAPRTSTEE